MKTSKRMDWLHLAGALVLLAVGVWVRWADWRDIWLIFVKDPESSHVILVLPVAAYLVWIRRERLRRVKFRTSWLGPLVVAGGSLVCYYGDGHGYQSLRHLGAITTAVGCLLTMLGRDVLANFAPAFLVLVFLLPMPPTFRQRISLPLMSITARITEEILLVLGATVERSGNQLLVNGVPILIVEACNGLRMFFTLVLVSFVVAFSLPLRPYVRILMVALSPVSAIVCNVVRLVPTVWVIGTAREEVRQMFHDVAGWVMLPVSFVMLYAVVWALKWAMVPVSRFTLARD